MHRYCQYPKRWPGAYPASNGARRKRIGSYLLSQVKMHCIEDWVAILALAHSNEIKGNLKMRAIVHGSSL